MATYLDQILDAHRTLSADDNRSVSALIDAARRMEPARGFSVAIEASARRGDVIAVIAEVKRRSPSRGELAARLDPTELASAYAMGGAACLSVLTDERFFGGSAADLAAARASCELPTLRKDFTVSEADVCDTRLMGADCVLLIAAALDDAELESFHDLAREVGLDVLVEIHDEHELERALRVGATLIGVNQRDLFTFLVDVERAQRLGPLIPGDVTRVAESGVRGAEDAGRLAAAGYDAVLVGEMLVTHPRPAAAVQSLRMAGGLGSPDGSFLSSN